MSSNKRRNLIVIVVGCPLFFVLLWISACRNASPGSPGVRIRNLIDVSTRLPVFPAGVPVIEWMEQRDFQTGQPWHVLAEYNHCWRRSAVVAPGHPAEFDLGVEFPGKLQFWAAARRDAAQRTGEDMVLKLEIITGAGTMTRDYLIGDQADWVRMEAPATTRQGSVRYRFSLEGDDPLSADNFCILVGSPAYLETSTSIRPNVILVIVDALRDRDVGLYGSDRADTPFLDSFSRRGITFADAISTTSWTLPSMKNMMSGQYTNAFVPEGENLYSTAGSGQLIQEAFSANGWFTAAIVANRLIDIDKGFDRGFVFFDASASTKWDNGSSEAIYHRISDYLKGSRDKPFFLYAHIMDPHDPYVPIEPFSRICDAPDDSLVRESLRSRETGHLNYETGGAGNLTATEKEYLHDNYRGEIRQIDSLLYAIYRCLDDYKMADNTILLVTSDHGEEFGEHGYYQHSKTLYQESLRIPMVLGWPGMPGRGSLQDLPVSTIDIPATLSSLAGLGVPAGTAGIPVWPPDAKRLRERTLFAVLQHKLIDRESRKCWRAAYRQSRKLLWNTHSGWTCFDLDRDPDENRYLTAPDYESLKRRDDCADWYGLADELKQFMDAETARTVDAEDPGLDIKLRQLGYIE